LCLFGLLPVTGIDLDLAAAVLDADRQSADRIIERLLDAHLVEETAPDRYHMHDLIRLLARELAADTGLGGEQDRAFTRVLGHYLATVGRANTLAYPHRSHPPVPAVDLPPAPLADRQDAQRWLDDQRRNVIAVVRDALTGSTEHARLGLHLGLALNWHLHTEGAHIHETIGFYEDIVDVAIRLGERHSEAHAHYCLAVGLNAVGQPDTARTHHTTELAICRELGDSFGEQRALGNLGATHLQRQSPSEAIPFLQRQLELATDIDAPVGRVFALLNLGKAHHQLGHLDDAVRLLTEALRWYEKAGDHLRQCDALELLARVHIDLGQHDRAIALMTRGLDEARHIGYRLGEIWALTVLARARRLRGDTRAARQCAEQAVAISDDLRHTKARRDALDEYELLAAVTRS
jgi:tetratricopeptide (TPR) repeat protein